MCADFEGIWIGFGAASEFLPSALLVCELYYAVYTGYAITYLSLNLFLGAKVTDWYYIAFVKSCIPYEVPSFQNAALLGVGTYDEVAVVGHRYRMPINQLQVEKTALT